MEIPIYQIDAFTQSVFTGNPAAVCPLEAWLDDATLKSIARENNLFETAFFLSKENGYHIRWFTPEAEVDLCGHATLASAFVLFTQIDPSCGFVTFESKSGPLSVEKKADRLCMNFPSQPPVPCAAPEELIAGLGKIPSSVLKSEDYFVVFETEADITGLKPKMDLLKNLDLRGVIVTAPGSSVDFVSRFFAPALGIDEDPVTGSAHCALIPYWSKRLNKKNLHAYQVSSRGGELFCEDLNDRVEISGTAVQYMHGKIILQEES
ncbi:MAG TPA: PhzF family phenazine biosynthesis protein [Deltaproteobacteria bacterium]|nr:PhzF family phenazine biosynthesis protein [Deltaproteobacteria bacterium]